MSYSMSIRRAIERFLVQDDWKYTVNEEKEYIKMGINLNSKLKECSLLIDLRDDFYISYATINVEADEECRANVAEFLTRANYGMRWGNFELDMNDGEIRYKILVDCGDDCDCLPSPSVIKNSIYIPAQMMQKYGNGLLAVMYGFKTPAEAIKEIES